MDAHHSVIPPSTIQELSQHLREAGLRRIAQSHGWLSLPNHVTAKVMELAQRQDSPIGELTRIVATDPALVSRLLRTANLGMYAKVEEQTHDLGRALNWLGAQGLRDLIFIEALWGATQPWSRFHSLQRDVWYHSAASASVAQQLAEDQGSDASAAFLAGLLHDVGYLIGLEVAASELQAGRLDAALDQRTISTALGLCHEDLGTAIVRSWGIPVDVLFAIQRHHRTEEHSGLAFLVRQANAIAHSLGFGFGEPECARVFLEPRSMKRLIHRIDILLADYS